MPESSLFNVAAPSPNSFASQFKKRGLVLKQKADAEAPSAKPFAGHRDSLSLASQSEATASTASTTQSEGEAVLKLYNVAAPSPNSFASQAKKHLFLKQKTKTKA